MNKLCKVIAVVCVLALVMVFAGCAQDAGQKPDTASAPPVNTEDDTAASAPVTLRFSWWGGDARHQATLAAIDLYEEQNPNVTIEAEYGGYSEYYDKMVTQLGSNSAPDIMQVDSNWINDLYNQGEVFIDLYTLVDKIDISGIDPQFLEDYCEVDGKLQGIPKSVSTVMFIYNADFFDTFDIDPNTAFDWDNLLEIAAKVHTQDPESYLIEPHFGMMKVLVLSYMKQKDGSNMVTDDYQVGHSKEVIVDAFTYFQDLFDVGGVVPYEDAATISEADERSTWQNGKSGIIYNFDGPIAKIKGNSTFDLGVTLPPVMAGAVDSGIILKPGVLTSIWNGSENLDEATKFMDFYNNDKDALLALGDTRGVPPMTAGMQTLQDADLLDPNVSVALELGKANAGSPTNANTNNGEIDKIVQDVVDQVCYGTIEPDAAADELISGLTAKLVEIKP